MIKLGDIYKVTDLNGCIVIMMVVGIAIDYIEIDGESKEYKTIFVEYLNGKSANKISKLTNSYMNFLLGKKQLELLSRVGDI